MEWPDDGAQRNHSPNLPGSGQWTSVLPLLVYGERHKPPKPKVRTPNRFLRGRQFILYRRNQADAQQSHFTELKYGLLSGASASEDNTLRWCVGGTTHWSTQLEAGNWYNFAYDIDFDAQTVGLWASNGSDPLVSVVAGVSAATSTNSADWHVGELRLDNGGSDAAAEDWYWSGIFVESSPITESIAGPLA